VSGRSIRRAHEVARRRSRQLGDPPEPRKGRCGDAPLPARDGDRLDAQLVGELLLGQAGTAPRSAQSPPTPPLSWVPKLQSSYQSERPEAVRSFDVLSTVAQAYALPAALAALVELGEEERPAASWQLVPEDAAAELHASGPTLTSIFPMFSPRRSPRNAFGAFSIPSTIVSRYWSRPSRTQSAACCTNSPKRSKWSLMM
jgi:hypothetical protein